MILLVLEKNTYQNAYCILKGVYICVIPVCWYIYELYTSYLLHIRVYACVNIVSPSKCYYRACYLEHDCIQSPSPGRLEMFSTRGGLGSWDFYAWASNGSSPPAHTNFDMNTALLIVDAFLDNFEV